MKKSVTIAFISFIIIPGFVFSQESEKKYPLELKLEQDNSYLRAGINYANDWVFAGRKDSVAVPYLTPSLSYYHKSGLYASASFSYLVKSGKQKIDMYKFSAGYIFGKNNFYGGVSGSALYFNDSSYAVGSEVGGNVYAYAGYDFKIVELTLDAGALFSGSADIITGAELSKVLYVLNNKLWIWPSIYVLAGTQYYYSEYYKYRRTGMKGMHSQGRNGQTTSVNAVSLSESGKFRALAYELSFPLYYNIRDFRISFNPVYAIPVNPSTIASGEDSFKEDIENTFYWSAGISYKF